MGRHYGRVIFFNISPETLIILNQAETSRHAERTKQTQNSVTKLGCEWNVVSEQLLP